MDEFFNLRVVYNILTIHAIEIYNFFEKIFLFSNIPFSFSYLMNLLSIYSN